MPYVTSIEQMAIEKGRIEDRVEGRVEGQIESRLATQSEIALNLLRQSISLEVIVQATGLTVEQIQALQPNQ
jgi:predicted transposase/invertase (TIGR01784 family)